jgi:hypothetical protein
MHCGKQIPRSSLTGMTATATVHRLAASSITRRLRRLGGSVAGAVLVTFSLAVPGAARESVDPSTLNPAPPASFNATCFRDGSHISCSLAFSDPDILDEPSGIVCDGTELLVSQSRSVVGKRLYDADGNLLQRHFREYLDGTFTNPNTGRIALWTQHDTVVHNLEVPGDVATGTTKVSGLGARVWLAGGGAILTDAGTTLINSATDEVVRLSAHHPFDDYFRLGDAAALAPLCAALG